ncbi:MAG TPA: TIGR01212 family radical SAM protein, partial [Bdellovibrionales bacterium]|nr:TIGR01212 family radical SAM protein [Bdellovibrionales bacterium]
MNSHPYNPISQFYQSQFGEKVYKISVSVADTCPNREGLRGMKTCNFCDQWGSAAYHKNLEQPLRAQIEKVRSILKEKRKANKFLIYFQAYTTTFQKVHKLREEIAIALEYEDVVGVVIGTRPDCISDALLYLWNETAEKVFVAVELGVQSFDEEELVWMRRGHT